MGPGIVSCYVVPAHEGLELKSAESSKISSTKLPCGMSAASTVVQICTNDAEVAYSNATCGEVQLFRRTRESGLGVAVKSYSHDLYLCDS